MTLLNLQTQQQPLENTDTLLINTYYYLVVGFLAVSSNDAFPKGILQKLYPKHFVFLEKASGHPCSEAQVQAFIR